MIVKPLASPTFTIVDKTGDGRTLATAPDPGVAGVRDAIRAAASARRPLARTARDVRRAALLAIAGALDARAEALAQTICRESGKPIRDARAEVARAAAVFRAAAAVVTTRDVGRIVPAAPDMEGGPASAYIAESPAGVCAAITPFNYPLAGVAQKVAPALAAACPIIIKPSRLTPLAAIELTVIAIECGRGLPEGWISCVPCRDVHARPLLTDERVRVVTLTGSRRAGREIERIARRKRLLLELGGCTPAIVDRGADPEAAAAAVAHGAFRYSGQTCTSVQRVIVHGSVLEPFRRALVVRADALRVGDPLSPATDIGPVITPQAADRFDEQIMSAVTAGAAVVRGGTRCGRLCEPTILEGVPADHTLEREEAFLPIASLSTFTRFEHALDRANATPFGLQALLFTNDLDHVRRAGEALEFGSLVVNGSGGRRGDHLPFGGMKESGWGREGIESLIAALSETKTVVVGAASRAGA